MSNLACCRVSSEDSEGGRPRVTPGVPVIPPPKAPSMLNPFPYYNPTVPPPGMSMPPPPGPDKDKVRERLEKLKKQGELVWQISGLLLLNSYTLDWWGLLYVYIICRRISVGPPGSKVSKFRPGCTSRVSFCPLCRTC